MASISLTEVFMAIIFCFIFLHCLLFKKHHNRFLRNWPVLGMLPGLLVELYRIYDFTVEVLENTNLTFLFKGPWFSGMDMLVTVDPANIHYMLSSNFYNYTKGTDFKEVFDAFGDSILTTESEAWKNLRKASQVMINHHGFQKLSVSTTLSKLKDGLVPLLDRFAEEGTTVDLQDVFGRFMFDTTLVTVTGCDDPRSLSFEMPEVESAKALHDIGEGILYRHVKPRLLWKLQNWFGLGTEKKMKEANATFDRVCEKYISAKREEIARSKEIINKSEDILTSHLKLDATKYNLSSSIDDKFLRDTILTFILAGRDTIASVLTWFFWLLSENPNVLNKIRQEVDTNLPRRSSSRSSDYYDPTEQFKKLVYLHAALCETMRLYPPVPIERVSPVRSDELPSGHKVEANSKILILIYALGRMKAVWGEDASEFKPERWISAETGMLRHEPSFKFLAFNAGPRTCLGKKIAMLLMKAVVVEILQNFDIEVAESQIIEPGPHLILSMKHGFRVSVTKRP
ncbi:hypothetical protein N665_0094s0044 [Sinapis alba]|nr:hypothetical protein N665_0094s0044 [Sinapis alba]